MTKSKPQKGANGKVLSEEHLKSSHSFSTQLRPLRSILFGLHHELCRDAKAAQSFADYLVNGVVHQGNGFLKLHRGLVIQALRLLGGEEPEFSKEFSFRGKDYPYPYNLLFLKLKEIKDRSVRDEPTTWGVTRHFSDLDYIRKKRAMVQAILTLLNWPKFIKLDQTSEKKDELLQGFVQKINEILDPSVDFGPCSRLSGRLAEKLFKDYLPKVAFPQRIQLDLSQRTYKGRRDKVGTIPRVLVDQFGCNPFYADDDPVGSCTVLSEPGGKSRIITGYNGLLNSTDFYPRVRMVLDALHGDCSKDQSIGHAFTKAATFKEKWETKANERPNVLSVDLEAFTDNLSMVTVLPYLKLLNATDFQTIASSPILVNSEEVYPSKFLMGLKGTFEIASLVHHGIISSLTKEYRLCGDDLVVQDDDCGSIWKRYAELTAQLGLRINYSKTIRSPIVAVFCGEAYWCGETITPLRLPIYTLRSRSTDRRTAVRTAGSVADRLKSLPRRFRHILESSIIRMLGSCALRGRPIPKVLPTKLGGLGISHSLGLLKVLEKVHLRWYVTFSVREGPRELITRRYIPYVSPSERPIFTWSPNLLVEGGYTKPKKVSAFSPTCVLKDIASILEYFYFGIVV